MWIEFHLCAEQKSHSRAKRREIGASEQRGTQTALDPNVYLYRCVLHDGLDRWGWVGGCWVGGLLVPIGADFLSAML